MSNGNWTSQEEEQLATYIAEQVIGRASGRLDNECMFNLPRDCYFIGSLRSAYNDDERGNPLSQRDLRNKLAPVAFGAEFLVHPEGDEVEIQTTVRWACYYRVFPTYQQQLDFLQHDSHEETNEQPTAESRPERKTETDTVEFEDDEERTARRELSRDREDAQKERRQRRESRDTLCMRFRKISCDAVGNLILRRWADVGWEVDQSGLEQALYNEVQRAQQIVLADPERLRTNNSDFDSRINFPNNALNSESDYNRFLAQLQTEIPLPWRWEVQAEVTPHEEIGNDCLLAVNLTNVSPMPDLSFTREKFFFDTSMEFQFAKCNVLPFTLELAPRGFRYDRDLWGRGFNCAIEKLSDTYYRTTHTPVFKQMRYTTRTAPRAPFDELARDPIPVLEKIRRAMRDSLLEWDAAEREYQHHFGIAWQAQFQEEFERDKQQFLSEIQRFERGLELIRNKPDIRLAFQLTNETFRRAGDHPSPEKRKSEWRLFQIVFLVSQIPGIAALAHPDIPDMAEERNIVDIIYFPTGGGKTEAYLGVLVFHCFFDRLRGKNAGVTAWTRFPLRLLTLQQTQRMANIIGMAELVRREQTEPHLNGKGVAGFAVGYFVGKEATPNELARPQGGSADPDWSRAQDEQERQHWKRVVTCPACRTNTIRVDFDETAVRIRHRCTNENCLFPDGILPVYVIDNEIYRYLPSVVVGTIDKLAGLGNQRKFSLVFGQVTGCCTLHGYYNGKCCQKDCTDTKRLRKGVPHGMSGPTLFVQDELHLLREGLGTFDAHYETFTQELLRQFGQGQPLKVIASSATIEAFERQVEHLYGRMRHQARVFPSLGPTLGNSFYAETLSFPQRLFLGIIPHNKTIFNAMLELLQYYHETFQDLQRLPSGSPNPYSGVVAPGSDAWQLLIDNYVTSITYFLAGRDLSSIRTDLDAAVNTELHRHGYRQLEIREMTGSTSTDEVTRILEQVERACPPPGEAPDAILATSMISHGVDVDRFNAMLFYGMPRQNAEYIQSSSRVGRRRIGLVLACLHPVRERDQSHYAYFSKFHEFLGQMIEPVAINRWSKFSVQRTLPGLFMGILLQLLANRSGESSPGSFYGVKFVRKRVLEGRISEDDFIPLLEAAYGVAHPNNPAEEGFREEIRLRVQQHLDQIRESSGDGWISDTLFPRPMRSLRDVDEAIEIELDDAGSRWASQGK